MKEHILKLIPIISTIGGGIVSLITYMKTQDAVMSLLIIAVVLIISLTCLFIIKDTNKKEVEKTKILQENETNRAESADKRDIQIAAINGETQIKVVQLLVDSHNNEIDERYRYYNKALEKSAPLDSISYSQGLNIENLLSKIANETINKSLFGKDCSEETKKADNQDVNDEHKEVSEKSNVTYINKFKEQHKK